MIKRFLSYFILVFLTLNAFSWGASGPVNGEPDVVVIDNVREWNHPTKSVFAKYKIELKKIELSQAKNYPTFFVKLPYDPLSSRNDSYYNKVFFELLKANGWWNYSLKDLQDGVVISIKWDKSQKTMHKDFLSIESK